MVERVGTFVDTHDMWDDLRCAAAAAGSVPTDLSVMCSAGPKEYGTHSDIWDSPQAEHRLLAGTCDLWNNNMSSGGFSSQPICATTRLDRTGPDHGTWLFLSFFFFLEGVF